MNNTRFGSAPLAAEQVSASNNQKQMLSNRFTQSPRLIYERGQLESVLSADIALCSLSERGEALLLDLGLVSGGPLRIHVQATPPPHLHVCWGASRSSLPESLPG